MKANFPTRLFAFVASHPLQCRQQQLLFTSRNVSAPSLTLRQPDTRSTPARPTIPASQPNTQPNTQLSVQPKAEPQSPPVSIILLNVTTLLWATQHSIIKQTLSQLSPSTLNFVRFFIASLITLPSLPLPSRKTLSAYLAGIELGVYLFLGYAFQSVSLVTIPASRSAFLLYLNVKLVPILSAIIFRTKLTSTTILSAALAFVGTALLALDSSPDLKFMLSQGDLYSIAAATASALFILRLSHHAHHRSLTAISLTSVTVLSFIWTCQAPIQLPSSPQAWSALLYLGLVTTALCNYLQTIGQRDVAPERAAVIFALDPLYAAFFAYVWLGEGLGVWGGVGGSIIVLAALISATGRRTS